MTKLLSWLVGLPLAFCAIVFAVANRQAVSLDLWPFPWTIQAPLYLLVLGMFAIGILVGGLLSWLSGSRVRTKARLEARRANKLEYELEQLQKPEALTAPASEPPPSLPHP